MNKNKKNQRLAVYIANASRLTPLLLIKHFSGLFLFALLIHSSPLQAEEKSTPLPFDPFAAIQNEWKTPDSLSQQRQPDRQTSIAAIKEAVDSHDKSNQNLSKPSPENENAATSSSAGWIPLPSANSKLLKSLINTATNDDNDEAKASERQWVAPKNLNRAITTANKAAVPLPFTLPIITVNDKQIETSTDQPEVLIDVPKKEEPLVPAAPTRQVNLAPLPVLTLPAQEKIEATDVPAIETIPYKNASLRDGLAEKDWKELSQLHLSKASLTADRDAAKSIRLAGMPTGKALTETQTKPATTSSGSTKSSIRPKAQTAQSTPKTKAETADAESCNSANTYIKKQIAAIESDNKTIQALQAAITELGLSQKLNYTPGAARITATSSAQERKNDKLQTQ